MADDRRMPEPDVTVTLTTTSDRVERWRRRAAELGTTLEGWLELVADNAVALAELDRPAIR